MNVYHLFATFANEMHLDSDQVLHDDVTAWVTPIRATTCATEYVGLSPGSGFVIVDVSRPADLMALWNMRACGAEVFPWPIGHAHRIMPAARHWLQKLRDSGKLSTWRSGDGKPVGPRIWTWFASTDQPVSELDSLLAECKVEPIPSRTEITGGWRGDHPVKSNFSRTFSHPLAENGRSVEITLPAINRQIEAREPRRSGTITTQISIYNVTGTSPDWTFSVPNIRRFAPFAGSYHDVLSPFHRPTANGRAFATNAGGSETFSISAVPSVDVFGLLIESSGWSGHRNEAGIFATRLIERLGGLGSSIANQPGARAGLLEAAGTRDGRLSGAVVQRIKQHQGEWPGILAPEEHARNYPAHVFQYLLDRSILRPALPVACPNCTAKITVKPEDLRTQMKCEMCLKDFPLGLSLGMKPNGRNDWLYQLAGHVSDSRISEILPMMAALHVLTTSRLHGPDTVPHMLGWQVKGPSLDCEVDIAAIVDDGGLPAVIVGETKHFRDSIDENDLNNLGRIQQHLRASGIECFLLIAVMRPLRDEEITALRGVAARPFEALNTGSAIEPVLPIVLTEADLSVPVSDQHPHHWAPADGIQGLARESCRRNLGLTATDIVFNDGGRRHFQASWS